MSALESRWDTNPTACHRVPLGLRSRNLKWWCRSRSLRLGPPHRQHWREKEREGPSAVQVCTASLPSKIERCAVERETPPQHPRVTYEAGASRRCAGKEVSAARTLLSVTIRPRGQKR